MPPVFGITAPKCPRCGKSVYIAEQVIGPNSTPYHKPCLSCVTCNKRLDSTLLVEHDGLPLCKNCHRNHLGQGKGGFGKAVPVRANLPVSPDRKPKEDDAEEDEEEMMRRVTGISIRPRARDSAGHDAVKPPSVEPPQPLEEAVDSCADWKHITSLDDLVSSSSDVPRIQPRSEALKGQVDALYDSVGDGPPTQTTRVPATPPPKPASMRAARQPQPQPQTPTSPLQSQSQSTAASPPRTLMSSSSSPPPRTVRSPISPPRSTNPLPTPMRKLPTSSTSSYKTTPTGMQPHSPSTLNTGGGTPLCTRCNKPVYHAEQVIATSGSKVWHRPCLRCDVCSTTLQKGSLEESNNSMMTQVPLAENNEKACGIYCKICYKKYFGPRGIGAAGMSFPLKG
ncbi:unnamed protein product [Sympodiomycopsis kandeliae]